MVWLKPDQPDRILRLCHVTEYCAVIGTHSMVRGDKLLGDHACPRPLPTVWNGVWP